MNWLKYIYTYSSCKRMCAERVRSFLAIVWEVIPGYFLIIREFFIRFQQCVYSQYFIGQLRNSNIGHNYQYNTVAKECVYVVFRTFEE